MKAINFLLHTQQPILATSLQGDPNSDVSHDYILGSMIRGALIGRYLKQKNIKHTDDILDSQRFPDIKRLFFDASKTRYLNAYPVDIDKKRTLPIPLSWYKNKGEEFSEDPDKQGKPVYDFSKIPIDERDEDLSPKLLEEKFCTVSDSDVLLYRVKRRINIHNQRDRKRGRGIEGSGAVFHYEAIDAGQTFEAVVLCDSEEDKSIIESLLQLKDVWLGGSQSAGYGHVKIELLNNDGEWYEVGIDSKERIKRNENLTITLLSDTIICDKWGQTATDPERLRQLFSESLNEEIKFQEDGIYASSLIVGGFNRKWGLPLPQTPALAAGSVFVFEKIDLEPQKFQEFLQNVQTLEEQGIGERRVEGFGRFIFNWLDEKTEYETKLPNRESKIKQQVNTIKSLKPESSKIAADIANRIVRKKLDELLIQEVSTINLNNQEEISNNQLSRLMLVTRQALYEVEFEQTKPENERISITELAEPVHDLLRNLPSNARRQFERSKLDQHIYIWLNEPDTWLKNSWCSNPQTKKLVVANQPKVNIAGKEQDIDVYIALEYSLRLIMAVAKKTMKEKNND
ncbi:RAMP superfamily CRISPR-associated protein [Anabaena cylindrica UHCC 0172]|uniref:RAMP superfamily CRISPR-associated protein n=1 Tax=Anabaena cylindrica TaxID=1165 RepID=UPI002B1F0761|nr:RAMP superfamily CRISPR-associated protein [Anabaena cylindrica]MEA5554338.1 RAMP superfamily CRISPR-associated protein [Anabaena cylindrica UHCC 0172]